MRQTMEISEIFQIIAKRKWIIIAITILSIGIGFAYGKWFWEPVYRADTTLIVKSRRTAEDTVVDVGTISTNQMMAVTYGEIVESRAVLETVISDLNLDRTYEGLLSNTEAEVVESTEILKVSFDSTDMQEAVIVTDKIAEVFVETIANIESTINIIVLDESKLRRDPVNMGPINILILSTAGGFIIALLAALIIDYMDNTIKGKDDVESKIGLPYIGSIPDYGNKKGLVLNKNPNSPISESYRSIRTNIQFANIDGDVKTILFTSSNKSEGKTSTISNIALTMADAGHKTILIDCDFRNSSIHKAFGITNKYGVTDILLKGEDYKKNIHLVGQNRNLDVLTAGQSPSNPSELLYSKSMKKFIGELERDYDYVLVDTPPVLPVTDATVMASYIDGVILVCAVGKTEVESIKMTADALKKVEANILGAVLNKTSGKGKGSYYYYSARD